MKTKNRIHQNIQTNKSTNLKKFFIPTTCALLAIGCSISLSSCESNPRYVRTYEVNKLCESLPQSIECYAEPKNAFYANKIIISKDDQKYEINVNKNFDKFRQIVEDFTYYKRDEKVLLNKIMEISEPQSLSEKFLTYFNRAIQSFHNFSAYQKLGLKSNSFFVSNILVGINHSIKPDMEKSFLTLSNQIASANILLADLKNQFDNSFESHSQNFLTINAIFTTLIKIPKTIIGLLIYSPFISFPLALLGYYAYTHLRNRN